MWKKNLSDTKILNYCVLFAHKWPHFHTGRSIFTKRDLINYILDQILIKNPDLNNFYKSLKKNIVILSPKIFNWRTSTILMFILFSKKNLPCLSNITFIFTKSYINKPNLNHFHNILKKNDTFFTISPKMTYFDQILLINDIFYHIYINKPD